jgi:arylsulfatase A-like enzyme
MDRLAKEGVRFTDAHSPSAVCATTRYALLTGRYAWEPFNLAKDPAQKENRYASEPGKVKELTALMERSVSEGRGTPGPKQKNDVKVTRDKRAK